MKKKITQGKESGMIRDTWVYWGEIKIFVRHIGGRLEFFVRSHIKTDAKSVRREKKIVADRIRT